MTVATGPWPRPRLKIIDPLRWHGTAVPQRRWIVTDLIPFGAVTLLGGDGGSGKSLLALQLMISAATRKPWLGLNVEPVKAFGCFCEDDESELRRRTEAILRAYDSECADLADLTLMSRVGEDNVLLHFGRDDNQARDSEFFRQLEHEIKESGAQLIVLDSLHDLFAGNENIRPQARLFMNRLRRVALEVEGAVVLIQHPSADGLKSRSGTSGSTAWNNAARSRLYLERPRDGEREIVNDERVLRVKKANHAPAGIKVKLRWERGCFVRDEPVTGLMASINAQALQKQVLQAVELLEREGDRPSPSSKSPSFLPKLLLRLDTFAGIPREDIERAMRALIAQGAIIEAEEKYGNGTSRRVLKRAQKLLEAPNSNIPQPSQ